MYSVHGLDQFHDSVKTAHIFSISKGSPNQRVLPTGVEPITVLLPDALPGD